MRDERWDGRKSEDRRREKVGRGSRRPPGSTLYPDTTHFRSTLTNFKSDKLSFLASISKTNWLGIISALRKNIPILQKTLTPSNFKIVLKMINRCSTAPQDSEIWKFHPYLLKDVPLSVRSTVKSLNSDIPQTDKSVFFNPPNIHNLVSNYLNSSTTKDKILDILKVR